MLCAKCDDTTKLRRGDTYLLRCQRCCQHTQGEWLITENFAGYRRGFRSYACANGCGAVLREEAIDADTA